MLALIRAEDRKGNAPVLAGVEHQAGVAKLQADWQAGAQDEQNENEVG